MRALFDVNILIALLDAGHAHHRRAMAWFVAHVEHGWASCPLTQNGCLRILSQPGYAAPQPLPVVAQRLSAFTGNAAHEFWPDAFSILDPQYCVLEHSLGPRQLTDIYLLALAVANGGRLVTFDQRIAMRTVPGATQDHLLTL